ncbi:MAG: CRISPR-associated endoribonuclease Cas6 [Arachidicoccus sp.]|nr:CRISPR-associated endoribonuclease Cas6 [Arachidicoccus sp.]
MRFRLKLFALNFPAILPLNYQYPLSAVVYKILQQADSDYAYFLHETGYRRSGNSLKTFKLFTFSDIKTPFKIQGDRMHMLTPEAEVIVSFHLPQAAEVFIKGLFLNQEIEIADRKSRTKFRISQVESAPLGLSKEPLQEIVLQPLSLIVSSKPNENGYYDFLAPEHPDFIPQLMYNWQSKYKILYNDVEDAFADTEMEVLFYKNPPRARLITIKAYTPEETKVKGYVNFQLKIKGKLEALELLINAGVGVYNSTVGGGCVCIEKR